MDEQYLSECCGAQPTGCDESPTGAICKGCYNPVDMPTLTYPML